MGGIKNKFILPILCRCCGDIFNCSLFQEKAKCHRSMFNFSTGVLQDLNYMLQPFSDVTFKREDVLSNIVRLKCGKVSVASVIPYWIKGRQLQCLILQKSMLVIQYIQAFQHAKFALHSSVSPVWPLLQDYFTITTIFNFENWHKFSKKKSQLCQSGQRQ